MRLVSDLPAPSKRQTSTLVAWAEKSAKLTPFPSQLAPRGYGKPSMMVLSLRSGAFMPDRQRKATIVPTQVQPGHAILGTLHGPAGGTWLAAWRQTCTFHGRPAGPTRHSFIQGAIHDRSEGQDPGRRRQGSRPQVSRAHDRVREIEA